MEIPLIVKAFIYNALPDKFFIQLKFVKNFKKFVNFKNPKTLNEKIQWLKLFDRTTLHTTCADKFLVRKFICSTIGKKYLIPLIYATDNIDSINLEILPCYPFIIKANHNSGSYIIVRNLDEINLKTIKTNCKKWLKVNYYHLSKEWQYKNIEPKIIIEKLLMQKDGKVPYDLKAHCINGKIEMISVDIDRGSSQHNRNWYNRNWEKLPYKWCSVLKNGKKTDPCDIKIDRPKNLDELINCTEIIAKYFSYVRVDWYEVDGCLYFGEITFHHDSGFKPIEPKEWDYILGQKLILPDNKNIR